MALLGAPYIYNISRLRVKSLTHSTTQTYIIVGKELDMYREWKKTEFPKEYCI
jgi:hypothetical protein